MPIKTMEPSELFELMKPQCDPPQGGRPPFTLIIGSGFSYPLVPTTSQIVREDLAWWKWCQHGKEGPTRDDYRNQNEAPFAAEAKARAKAFWKRIDDHQTKNVGPPPATKAKPFLLDAEGVPTKETVGEAYRYALNCSCGLHNSNEIRQYFGDMIRRIGNRLNPAHLYLAAIVAERPRMFGTAFTTNFDPLLQRSLQLFNAPYFVSDRPETSQTPDDDNFDRALHLVHAHGSIYRYILASSPEEIEEFAEKNHSLLADYFSKHTVLVIGFSGWDDAIKRAKPGDMDLEIADYTAVMEWAIKLPRTSA